MANTLYITKINDLEFEFVVNGDTANAITNSRNDLTAIGTQLHFKTSNGSNLILKQEITPPDVTIEYNTIAYTGFTTVQQVFDTLISAGYFDWINPTGGTGVTKFVDLDDTFSFVGQDGKIPMVDENNLILTPVPYNYVVNATDLADMPNAWVADKMLATDGTGTSVVLVDLPTPPEQFLNAVGSIHYNDAGTTVTPIALSAGIKTKLTNDALGTYTIKTNAPYGVPDIWDSVTNQMNFTSLSIGDQVLLRYDITITTNSANQTAHLDIDFGIGSLSAFNLRTVDYLFKSAGTYHLVASMPFDLSYQDIIDNPAEISITSDGIASVVVTGFYFEIIRKNINVIDITGAAPIQTISVNGVNQPIFAFNVDITVPTALADLTDDATHRLVTDTEKSTWNAKEDASNKSVSVVIDQASDVKYPSVKAVYDWAVATFQTIGSFLAGSGTTNKIPKFTGATSLGDSQITDNGTNVGVNSTSTNAKFNVKGTGNTNATKGFSTTNTDNVETFYVDDYGNIRSKNNIYAGTSGGGYMYAQIYDTSASGRGFSDGTGNSTFTYNDFGAGVKGWLAKGILKSFADYSANYDALSFITKGYADANYGGGLTGSGTTNKIPKFTGSTDLGDSQITDNGTDIAINTTIETGVKFKIKANTTDTGGKVVKIEDSTGAEKAHITDKGRLVLKNHLVVADNGFSFLGGNGLFSVQRNDCQFDVILGSPSINQTADLYSSNTYGTTLKSKGFLSLQTGATPAERINIDTTGKTKLNAYGSGTQTGTPTYALNVDASGNIIEGALGGGATNLDSLTDVTITTPTTGQVLKYNGSIWVNDTDAGGGASALDDLTDVTITTPSTGQVLKYNGTTWVNDTDAGGGGYNYTTFNNTDYTALSTDVNIAQVGALSAPRTVTLPLANSVDAGYSIIIEDVSGTCSETNTITVQPAGGNGMYGGNAVISSPYYRRVFYSNGVDTWTNEKSKVTLNTSQTLTNKRITKRVSTVAYSTPLALNTDGADVFKIFLSGNITFNVPSGTPTDGQAILIKVKDNSTPATLSFNTSANGFKEDVYIGFPTTTIANEWLDILFVWNIDFSKWVIKYVNY